MGNLPSISVWYPAYPKFHDAGYSVLMFASLTETMFAPSTLIWMAASLFAATLLFGAMNERRANLTDTLRAFVDRQGKKMGGNPRSGEEADD